MNEEYLWDRSGPPDPDIERLEKELAVFRYRGPKQRRPQKNAPRPYVTLAAAAAAVLAFATWEVVRITRIPAQKTSWQAVAVAGKPRINGRTVADPAQIFTGQRIETDAASTVQIRSDFVGQVQLDPNSEMYVKESGDSRQLLSLRRGVLHALIWAPPSQFAVDTPSVRAVDLGCQYTLETQLDGNGLITVQRGWVAFDRDRTESFIPAGAACRTNAHRGPGIPWFEDAPEPFRQALARYENTGASDALQAVIVSARRQDGLTLWHLLSRASARDRGAVFDRFSRLVKLPPEVQRSAVLAGDPHAFDRCWNALDLGDTSWWRTWKRAW